MISVGFYIASSILCFFSLIHPLYSTEYGIFAKRESSAPIKKFFVISERCSGSNYITSLVEQNSQLVNRPLGSKHFPPWYDLPESHYSGNPQYYTFENTEDYLFIVSVREPYDWLRSFHKTPHHAHKSLKNISFKKFIDTRWIFDPDCPCMASEMMANPFVDMDINHHFVPFKNVMMLRTAKIKNMLQVKDKAPNVYIINYEIVRDHPEKVLEEINRLFQVDLNPVYEPVTYYKGNEGMGEYQPKEYRKISKKELKHINRYLDMDVENSIGYRIIINYKEFDN